MKRKLFFTGSVFQFYIKEINKYSYCKYFDFKHINPFHGLIAQVFNFFSDEAVVSLDELARVDWLFGGKSMYAWPDLKKGTGWKYIGILNATEDENVPVFKAVQSFTHDVEDCHTIGPWYPIYNLGTRGKDCTYDNVKHLETKILTTGQGLEWRAGMEYCRINNIDVRLYYDLDNNEALYAYWEMINMPVYSAIPQSIRGKALPHGIDNAE